MVCFGAKITSHVGIIVTVEVLRLYGMHFYSPVSKVI